MTKSAGTGADWAICDWMIRELDLSGNELVLYSLVYSYGEKGLNKSTSAIGHMTNLSPTTVKRTLANLEAKRLVRRNRGASFEPSTWFASKRQIERHSGGARRKDSARNRQNRVLSITKSEDTDE